jgi:hypothetical protein
MILFWPKASVFKKEQFSQKMALSLHFFIYLYISRGNDIYFVEDILCAYRLLRINFSGLNKCRVNVFGNLILIWLEAIH